MDTMRLEEYKHIFDETAVYPARVDKFDLCYLYLGLIDELHELYDAIKVGHPIRVLDEAGDVFWYTNGIDIVTGIDKLADMITYGAVSSGFPTYTLQGAILEDINKCILSITKRAGKLKKYYRDGRPDIFGEVNPIMEEVIGALERALSLYNFSVEEVLRYNHSKLLERKNQNTLHDIDRHE